MMDSETYNISRHFDDVLYEIECGLEKGNVLVHTIHRLSLTAKKELVS